MITVTDLDYYIKNGVIYNKDGQLSGYISDVKDTGLAAPGISKITATLYAVLRNVTIVDALPEEIRSANSGMITMVPVTPQEGDRRMDMDI